MNNNREAAIRQLQIALDYQFQTMDWLNLALTHSSAGGRDNERLEFLGDSVLGFVISERLFMQFPEEAEGGLTRLRARLVRGQTLGMLAGELNLGDCLLLGVGERKTGGQRRNSILANALEAVFGAILIDGGYAAVRHSILTIFNSRLQNLPPAESLKDAKTRLQEFLQARGQNLPKYKLVKKSGPEHARVFTVNCRVTGHGLTSDSVGHEKQTIQADAAASSRRKAEQHAAEDVLRQVSSDNT